MSARPGYTLVSLGGEGDVTVHGRLRAALAAQVAAGTPYLVADLSGLAYTDCSCLQVLRQVARMAEEAGGTLELAAPQPLVARGMELCGTGQVIGVHDSVAEAATAAGRKRDSRLAGPEPPTVRGDDGQPGPAPVDGLLLRVARGDAEAFAIVYDLVAGVVYSLALRVVGDQPRAEQVAAEVLAEVWRSAPRFRPAEGSGLSWVMTMTRRRALGHDNGAAGDDRTAGLGPSGAAGPERAAGSLPEHPGLASLPGPQREAVLLASCGYTLRQVADLAGVPARTAAGRLREGLLGLSSPPEMLAGAPGHSAATR